MIISRPSTISCNPKNVTTQKGTALIRAMAFLCMIMFILLVYLGYLQLCLQNTRMHDEYYEGALRVAEAALISAYRDINRTAKAGADLTTETVTGRYSSPVLMIVNDIPYRYATEVANFPLATKVILVTVTFPDPLHAGNVVQSKVEMTLQCQNAAQNRDEYDDHIADGFARFPGIACVDKQSQGSLWRIVHCRSVF